MHSGSKKAKGGLGAQQDGKEDIRNNAEFALCALGRFFAYFFDYKKVGSVRRNSISVPESNITAQKSVAAFAAKKAQGYG